MTRPLAYITAPFGGGEQKARTAAMKYCRTVYEAGYSPVCPILFQPLFLKKDKAVELKDGRDMANELLRRSRILVVCGKGSSDDMLEDIAIAEHYMIPTTTLDGITNIETKKKKK